MTSDELLAAMRAKPFRPFVLTSNYGVRVVVSGPRQIANAGGNIAAGMDEDGQIHIIDLDSATLEFVKE